jgi:hypothetical protein
MPSQQQQQPRFPLGKITVTPHAVEAFFAAHQTPHEFMDRHRAGDWGEISQYEKEQNERGLKEELRIISVYRLKTGVRIWILTNANRTATSILLVGYD